MASLKVIRKRAILKPGGLIVLRHYFKVRPKLGDFKLERQVRLGDDVLSLFTAAADSAAAGASAAETAPERGLSQSPRSLKMGKQPGKDRSKDGASRA